MTENDRKGPSFDPEQLERLKRSVDEWNEWRRSHSDVEVHLEWVDLSGVHLKEADLREAHLEGANLERAHLEGSCR